MRLGWVAAPDPTRRALLDELFSAFDAAAGLNGIEKIKTIGDGYMAACGLPDADPDHLAHACDLALDMVAAIRGDSPPVRAVRGLA